jgi:hypothetical protein
VDERQRRLGENEALFREVNDRLEDLNEAFNAVTEHVEIVCECGEISCVERITLTLDDYERLRADPTTFAVLPGHEAPDVEFVVAEAGRFVVVRKRRGEPAEVAASTDSRS